MKLLKKQRNLLKGKMLKPIIEYIIASTVIFIGINIAIGLLILIVSTLEDFFFQHGKEEFEKWT